MWPRPSDGQLSASLAVLLPEVLQQLLAALKLPRQPERVAKVATAESATVAVAPEARAALAGPLVEEYLARITLVQVEAQKTRQEKKAKRKKRKRPLAELVADLSLLERLGAKPRCPRQLRITQVMLAATQAVVTTEEPGVPPGERMATAADPLSPAAAPLVVALLATVPLAAAPPVVALLATVPLAAAPPVVALLATVPLAVAPPVVALLAVAPMAAAPQQMVLELRPQ